MDDPKFWITLLNLGVGAVISVILLRFMFGYLTPLIKEIESNNEDRIETKSILKEISENIITLVAVNKEQVSVNKTFVDRLLNMVEKKQ